MNLRTIVHVAAEPEGGEQRCQRCRGVLFSTSTWMPPGGWLAEGSEVRKNQPTVEGVIVPPCDCEPAA